MFLKQQRNSSSLFNPSVMLEAFFCFYKQKKLLKSKQIKYALKCFLIWNHPGVNIKDTLYTLIV